MVNNSTELDQVFFALSGAPRRRVLQQIYTAPARVSDLAEAQAITLPALHKHIQVLERAQLISKEKVGRQRFVSANLGALLPAEAWINTYTQFWTEQLDALDAYVATLRESS